MAITVASTNVGQATSKAAATSLGFAYTATIAAGAILLACIALDNLGSGTDGDKGDVSSVSDDAGNTYTKIAEFSNVQTGSGTGSTISIWKCKLTNGVSAANTLTFNFSGSVTAKAGRVGHVTVAAGNDIRVAGSIQTLANDAADAGSQTVSGLTSKEYLFLRGTAYEAAGVNGTVTTNFTKWTDLNNGTSGGGAATNMGLYIEHRILTGTTATSDPTTAAVDNASIFVALEEYTPVVASVTPDSLVSKSQITGTALGTDKVADPAANWTTSNATITDQGGGVVRVTTVTGGTFGFVYQAISGLTVGQLYKLTFTAGPNTSGQNLIGVDSSIGGLTWSSNLGQYFLATATTMYVSLYAGSSVAGQYAEFSNIVLSEMVLSVTAHDPAAVVTPNTLVSASLLDSPTVTFKPSVTPASLVSASLLGTPSITAHNSASVTPDNLISASLLGVPTVVSHAIVSPASLVSGSALGVPSVAWKTSISPGALISPSQLGVPILTAHAVVTPNPLQSATQLSSPTITYQLFIDPDDMTSYSQLGVPFMVSPYSFSYVKGVFQDWPNHYEPVYNGRQLAP